MCSLRPGVYASAATLTALVRDARDERARQAGQHLLRVAAALAVTGSRSAGSHRSAARVYGLGLVGPGPGPRAEITRSPGERAGHANRAGVLVHIAALPADHVVSYRGVPLTSVPRTVIDLTRTLPFAEGVALADSALHAGLTSKSALAAVIEDCPRWRGLQRARAQLDRDARLRAAGYEVVHFTWPEITRVPAQVVDSVRLAFSRTGVR